MNSNIRKKAQRGRNMRYNSFATSDTKNNFRDNYSSERRKNLSNFTLYNLARFFMGNEIQIQTRNERIEGVLRSFDSLSLWLSKVVVYDIVVNDNFSMVKESAEGKDVPWCDIVSMKVLGTNGKTDSVVVDQEISQRKQISKPLPQEDKNLVPYFDDDDAQLDDGKEDDDLGIPRKGEQCCWYNPEDMLKINEERFNLKSTFNDTMEEYTTPIDKNDPLLQEKYERAEKLAREMENDTSLRRVRQLEDEEDEEDEETRFSAVCASAVSSASKPETLATQGATAKLNPNAPEFHPRTKTEEPPIEEMTMANMYIITDSIVQQQQQQAQQQQQQAQQQQQQQQAQQQQYMQRFALQFSMGPQQGQAGVAQAPSYQGQRLMSGGPQWTTVPMHHGGSPGQYVLQPYLHQAQLMPSMFQARPMGVPESGLSVGGAAVGTMGVGVGGAGAGGNVFYTLGGQLYVGTGDHLSSSVSLGPGGISGDGVPHIYTTTMDGHHVSTLQSQQHALAVAAPPQPPSGAGAVVSLQSSRQPHIVTHAIPVIPQSLAHMQQQQQQAPPQQPSSQQQQHISTFYTQTPHHIMAQSINAAAGHPNIQQIIYNQQAQLQAGPTIQNYIPNGRP